MKGVDFPEANATLSAPAGKESEIDSLQVHRADGFVLSCWELSDEDLAKLQETRQLWLFVWSGTTQPPMALSCVRPFELGEQP